ncbi:MAG: hybrid sensor histidine kinase/response regulator [Deltaproteobacteria bacterium]|nr:hybrid sensor histidine kinase/response regulator [Deltaproteobacteria bacterium]
MSAETIKILLVEDNPGDAWLLRDCLTETHTVKFDLEHVARLSEALDCLSKKSFDVVLLDLSLPDESGLTTVVRVQEVAREVPIVVLTGLDDESVAISALREGAEDYLVKGQVEGPWLWRALRYAMERKRAELQVQRQLERLEILREELESTNRRLERANKIKSEFLSIMSHELRTPVAAIVGYSEMVKDGLLGEVNPGQARALGRVTAHSEELLTMIAGVLQAASIVAGEVEPKLEAVDLNLLLTGLKDSCTAPPGKGVTISWDYPSEIPSMVTDGKKIHEILRILIANAIKFTERGTVSVSIHQFSDSSTVEFEVSDTGVGIPEEKRSVIFDMFRQADNSETRSYGGIGLGLYIVKNYVEMLNGSIDLESEPGVGSTFTITFPCNSPSSALMDKVSGHEKRYAQVGNK